MTVMIRGIAFVAILLSYSPLFCQGLIHVGQFDAYGGSVQFLPGAVVVVRQPDGDAEKKTVFRYKNEKKQFVETEEMLSPETVYWQSFNWDTIDFLDQISRADFEDPELGSLLPKGSKIKAFAKTAGFRASETLVFVCYSLKPSLPETEMIDTDQRDIYIAMFSRGPMTKHTRYLKLANVAAQPQSYFGTMVVERQPEGIFVALYSAGGGHQQINSLDVFLVQP